MSATLWHERENIYRLEISGTLGSDEFGDVQDALSTVIRRVGGVRLLVVLTRFKGWAPGHWNDLSFYVRHGSDIERIAIVGDERWRSEAMILAGADLRTAPVAYFSPPYRRAAFEWLAGPAPVSGRAAGSA